MTSIIPSRCQKAQKSSSMGSQVNNGPLLPYACTRLGSNTYHASEVKGTASSPAVFNSALVDPLGFLSSLARVTARSLSATTCKDASRTPVYPPQRCPVSRVASGHPCCCVANGGAYERTRGVIRWSPFAFTVRFVGLTFAWCPYPSVDRYGLAQRQGLNDVFNGGCVINDDCVVDT